MLTGTSRTRTILATAATVTALGALLQWMSPGPESAVPPGSTLPAAYRSAPTTNSPASDARADEVAQRFRQGVIMLHAREHEHAAAAFHRVLALTPRLPEAHVNMGFAMLGQFRHGLARDFFESAIALRPSQRNAYYGLAAAFEGLGDLRGAVGAMRTYVHLSPPDDPYLRKANAALWEWNTALASAQASRSRS
jgi:tetratricopeptide (TPR) repeat protein